MSHFVANKPSPANSAGKPIMQQKNGSLNASNSLNGLSNKIPKLNGGEQVDSSPRLFMIKKNPAYSSSESNGSSKEQSLSSGGSVSPTKSPKTTRVLNKSIEELNTYQQALAAKKRSSLNNERSSLPDNKLIMKPHKTLNNINVNHTNTSLSIHNNSHKKYSIIKPTSESSILTLTSSTNTNASSKESSFVQLNEKLLNRGMQTEFVELSAPNSTSKIAENTSLSKDLNNKSNNAANDLNNEQFNEKDKIRVVVRIRPINEFEKQNGDNEIISCDRTSLIVEGKTQSRKFMFDSVFDPHSTQEEIFNFSGIKRLINMAIDGYICTCFAYGQTGSGKTYSMVGPSGTYVMNSQDRFLHFGLIPRSINYLFNQLRVRTQQSNSVFYIRVSYYEIYNEQIRDLINPNSGRKLEIRGSQEEGFFVDNLFATYIETMEEILTILQEGELNRATASHLLNEHSSRSHAILTIQVENELQNSQDPKEQITKLGKMIFVDLAGSEKVKVTHSKGKQLVETNNINKSLLVLGTCISALSDSNKRDGHIPYRDSKLTKLLSESLGGTGITLMIACVSPSFTCENETLNTLRYANRAQNIENVPLMKSDSRENIVQKLKRELRKLREENLTLKQQLGFSNNPINHANNANHANNIARRLPKLPGNQNSARNGSSNSNASSSETDLYGMLQEYIQENKTLKSENSQLEKFREKIRQQHEILTRENEKLARKLEQVLRSQGNQNSIEYVVLSDNTNSNKPLNNDSSNFVKQQSYKQLPRIEKQNNNSPSVEATSLRSNSPLRKVDSKKYHSSQTYSDSGESFSNNNSIDQIEIIKPSYTRKFKEIKDFKTTKSVNEPPVQAVKRK